MRTQISAFVLAATAVLFGGQGIPEAHGDCVAKNVTVKANQFFNATGIHASFGESFLLVASGIVNISTLNGGYRTGPDGTLEITPAADSGAFEFFRDRAGPLFTDPVKGSRKSFLPLTSDLPGHLPGAPYGALVAGFSPTVSPSSFNDFPDGFALINTKGIARAPNTGGYLFLGVNDFNNPGGETRVLSESLSPVVLNNV